MSSMDEHQRKRQRREAVLRAVIPAIVVAALLLGWELMVRINDIPHYILPAPSRIWITLVDNWPTLWPQLWFTSKLKALRANGRR